MVTAKFLGVFANSWLDHAKLYKAFKAFEYEKGWRSLRREWQGSSKRDVYHDSLLHTV